VLVDYVSCLYTLMSWESVLLLYCRLRLGSYLGPLGNGPKYISRDRDRKREWQREKDRDTKRETEREKEKDYIRSESVKRDK